MTVQLDVEGTWSVITEKEHYTFEGLLNDYMDGLLIQHKPGGDKKIFNLRNSEVKLANFVMSRKEQGNAHDRSNK